MQGAKSELHATQRRLRKVKSGTKITQIRVRGSEGVKRNVRTRLRGLRVSSRKLTRRLHETFGQARERLGVRHFVPLWMTIGIT